MLAYDNEAEDENTSHDLSAEAAVPTRDAFAAVPTRDAVPTPDAVAADLEFSSCLCTQFFTCRHCLGVQDRDRYRALVAEVYSVVNPSKLVDLDALFVKYEGNERQLYLMVCRKYSVIPPDGV